MRYFVITYLKKPNGQIDEQTAVAKNLKRRDIQCANVIIDFKDLKVVKATMNGSNIPQDFDRIIDYYMQFYEATFKRLFNENGYDVTVTKNEQETKDDEKQDNPN